MGHAHLHTIAPYHCGCYVPKPFIKYCTLLVSTHWNWPPRPGWKKWTSQSISRSSARQLISQDAWILPWNTSHWFSWIHRDLSVIYETFFHGQRDNVNSPILGWHSAEIQSPRHVSIGILRSLKYGSLNCFSPMFSHQNGRQMHIHPSNYDLSTDLIYDFICHPVILGGYGKSPQQFKSFFITGHFPELRWYIYNYIYVITPSHKVLVGL